MKSEFEKMQASEWYDANYDDQLITMRIRAQDRCFEYNQTKPSDKKKRESLLKKLFGEELEGVELIAPIWVDYGKNTHFGQNVFVNRDVYFMDGAPIIIGDNVFIGPQCGFYTATHPENREKRNSGLERALPIVVERDVWIGANVSVMPGVTIGEGAVIGAGSVVTRDIPKDVVAAGSPCKIIRPIDHNK